jgi:hypothetical protein
MTHTLLGTKIQNSSSSSVSITLSAGAAIGSTVLVAVVWESSAASVPTISAVTDSRSNTYSTTPDVSVNAGSTLAMAVLRTRVSTALQVGDTITVTISGGARTRWAMQADAFDDLKTSPLDRTVSNAPGSASSLSSGTTSTTQQSAELLYAAFGFGSGKTVTIPGGWTGSSKVETSAGSTDRALQVIWQYVDDEAAEQATLTINSSSTYGGVLATYKTTAALVAHVSQVKFEAPLPGDALLARVSQVAMEVPRATTGQVRVSQVRLTVPSKAGQPPYSGLKACRGGQVWDATISSATGGTV